MPRSSSTICELRERAAAAYGSHRSMMADARHDATMIMLSAEMRRRNGRFGQRFRPPSPLLPEYARASSGATDYAAGVSMRRWARRI